MRQIQAQREINGISPRRGLIAPDTVYEKNNGRVGVVAKLTGMLDGHTDAQMGKMTDRQADRYLLCKPPWHEYLSRKHREDVKEKQTEFWHLKKEITDTYITFNRTKPGCFRCGDSDIWFGDRGVMSQMWSEPSEGEEREYRVWWRDSLSDVLLVQIFNKGQKTLWDTGPG